MTVWVVNTGSSSLKVQVLAMPAGTLLFKALVERLGQPGATLHLQGGDPRPPVALPGADIATALADLQRRVAAEGIAPPALCVHRVVHGGERFTGPVCIDEAVLEALRALQRLAPLHLPGNIAGIEACRRAFPEVVQIGVFDTAFHATLAPQAFRYAIPADWHALGLRRYGFHGSSHQFVAGEYARWQGRPANGLNLVTVHLGNGSSLCAVQDGQSVDTTMGVTPLEGLVMGTRCGDIDPGIPGLAAALTGLPPPAIDAALWQESGLKGLCGSADMRDVLTRAGNGDTAAMLARDVFCHSLRKHLGAMMAVLGRTDAIVFTGGIGENSAAIRQLALQGLEGLGIELCGTRNTAAGGGHRRISADTSRVMVAVVPTNEEAQMARLAWGLIDGEGLHTPV